MSPYSISFVLPMFNEREVIEDTVKEISVIANAVGSDYEIIIADDASTDGSAQIADRLTREDPHIKVIHLAVNTKFGGALAAGLKNATKDIIIYTDSDLPVGLPDVKKSLLLIEDTDIVTATSIVKKGDNIKRKIISLGYNFLIQSLFKADIKDINSGYKIYKRSIVKDMDLKSVSPFVDVEIFLRAKKLGARIKEYPLHFQPRKYGVSKISRIPVIWQTFMDMFKFKFSK